MVEKKEGIIPYGMADVAYDPERKGHKLWGQLLREFAPSKMNEDPSRTIATPMLPDIDPLDVDKVRANLTQGVLTGNTITTRVVIYPPQNPANIEDTRKKFLISVMDPSVKSGRDLGIHTRNASGEGSSTIFLPYDTNESHAWGILYNTANILGKEGQALLLRHLPDTLESLADDMAANQKNQTVKEIYTQLSLAGYEHLLNLLYLDPVDPSAKIAAQGIVIAQHFKGDALALRRAAKILGKLESVTIPEYENKHKTVNGAYVNIAAGTLEVSYEAMREAAEKAFGLYLTARGLVELHPDNKSRARNILAALTFMDNLNNHPFAESQRRGEYRHLVSRHTLAVARKEVTELREEELPGGLQGMSEGVHLHEQGHSLMKRFIRDAQRGLPEGKTAFIPSVVEERTIEAMCIVLGFRNIVEQCVYYDAPGGAEAINKTAEKFLTMSPAEREESLRDLVLYDTIIDNTTA